MLSACSKDQETACSQLLASGHFDTPGILEASSHKPHPQSASYNVYMGVRSRD